MGVIFKSTLEILCASRIEKDNLNKSLFCDMQENRRPWFSSQSWGPNPVFERGFFIFRMPGNKWQLGGGRCRQVEEREKQRESREPKACWEERNRTASPPLTPRVVIFFFFFASRIWKVKAVFTLTTPPTPTPKCYHWGKFSISISDHRGHCSHSEQWH